MQIATQSGRYSMVALLAEQYPVYKREEQGEKKGFLCNAEMFIKGFEYSLFAVGTDTLHPQMTGVLVDVHNDDVTFFAEQSGKPMT